jgi:lipoprotein-anchoring transpeptidase ErfK/SrfK
MLVGAALLGCGPTGRRPDPAETERAVADDREPVYLMLRLAERRLYLMEGDSDTPVESFPIAVGRKGHATPVGRFQIDEMVEHPEFPKLDPNDRSRVLKVIPPGPDNPLGVRWMTFARGDGWTVGIHGTPRPELLGQAVSGGCIRMRNTDVIRVYDRVRLGTRVVVEP